MAKKIKKVVEEVHDPILPSLTEVELLKLKLAEAEMKCANLSANIKLMERNAYVTKIDPENKLGQIEAEIRSFLERASQSKNKYNETIASVESRVGIKMSDYSYDDETGTLVPVTT